MKGSLGEKWARTVPRRTRDGLSASFGWTWRERHGKLRQRARGVTCGSHLGDGCYSYELLIAEWVRLVRDHIGPCLRLISILSVTHPRRRSGACGSNGSNSLSACSGDAAARRREIITAGLAGLPGYRRPRTSHRKHRERYRSAKPLHSWGASRMRKRCCRSPLPFRRRASAATVRSSLVHGLASRGGRANG